MKSGRTNRDGNQDNYDFDSAESFQSSDSSAPIGLDGEEYKEKTETVMDER